MTALLGWAFLLGVVAVLLFIGDLLGEIATILSFALIVTRFI